MPDQSTLPRSSGILLHPTSLPGPYGIGDLGPEAYRWIQTLAAARQSWWQVLPLGPTGAGDSPYQSFSAFAGNIALLSPEHLTRDGLLPESFTHGLTFRDDQVDYAQVLPFKQKMLREVWGQFRGGRGPHEYRHEFEEYIQRESAWLNDYALFMAIRDALGGAGLTDWPSELLRHEPVALAAMQSQIPDEVRMHQFGQFLFDRQWRELKRYAHDNRVRIIGDAPIFVSGDSSDVWANPQEYLLGADRKPSVVAGVPPDYFSPTGQHWGNPLYDWDRMADTGYAWWIARLRRNFSQVDLIRLDHFRGFAAAWHIPANEPTALNGRWMDGPRRKLFDRLQSELGTLPIIAEDLGLITPDVHELREQFTLPGMRILQFALGGPNSPFWPHNYEPLTVVYTGTHDNDTTNGWYATLNEHDRKTIADYLGHEVKNPAQDLIRLAWSSVAVLAVAPLQDIFELGSEARMNVPGTASGNWRWRFRRDQFKPGNIERLAEWTTLYNRQPLRE